MLQIYNVCKSLFSILFSIDTPESLKSQGELVVEWLQQGECEKLKKEFQQLKTQQVLLTFSFMCLIVIFYQSEALAACEKEIQDLKNQLAIKEQEKVVYICQQILTSTQVAIQKKFNDKEKKLVNSVMAWKAEWPL